MKRLLLISNSTQWGRGYLDRVEAEIRAFLGATCRVAFVPFALFDGDAYTAKVRSRFQPMGFDLRTVADSFDDFDAITVFDSTGTALQDVAAAASVYAAATRLRRGIEIDLGG
ncbi:MAG: Type 1 glutamine amidotransferase-like domain-containing protein [Myxococcales bacterium]